MNDGRRWLAIDADLFGKPFTDDLYRTFGWAGIATWVAFLCACKRSRIPGQIRIISEADARSQLGLIDWELVDNQGKTWTLDDFWTYTGRKKQTRRTSRGREMNVTSTHWRRWQEAAGRSREAERKSTSRSKNGRTLSGHNPDTARTNVRSDSDLDLDLDKKTPKPQAGGEPPDPESTSRTNGTNPRARGTNPRATGTNPRTQAAETRRELIPDWRPDPEPEGPAISQAEVKALRRRKDQP